MRNNKVTVTVTVAFTGLEVGRWLTVDRILRCEVSHLNILNTASSSLQSIQPLPGRKRQRLSSPTYDEQVDLSQEDIDAFDQIQQCISQSQSHSSPAARPTRRARDKENGNRNKGSRSISPLKALAFSSQSALEGDAENPFKVSTNNSGVL